jgi:hypothetical protein
MTRMPKKVCVIPLSLFDIESSKNSLRQGDWSDANFLDVEGPLFIHVVFHSCRRAHSQFDRSRN